MPCFCRICHKNDPLGSHVQQHVRHVTTCPASLTHPLTDCTELVFLAGTVLVPYGPNWANIPFSVGCLLKHVATCHVTEFSRLSAGCHVVAGYLFHNILKFYQHLTWEFSANWI